MNIRVSFACHSRVIRVSFADIRGHSRVIRVSFTDIRVMPKAGEPLSCLRRYKNVRE